MKKIDLNQRLNLLRTLILEPRKAWKIVVDTNQSTNNFQRKYIFPGLALLAFAMMLGMLIDAKEDFGPTWFIMIYSIIFGLAMYGAYRLSVKLIKWLLSTQDIIDEKDLAYQVLGFPLILGYMPLAFSSIFRSMFFLDIFSLYAFVIFWIGIQQVFSIAKDKQQVIGILAILLCLATHAMMYMLLLLIQRPILDLF